MIKNKKSLIFLALLFFAILPYNQTALIPSGAKIIVSLIIYTIRALFIVVVLLYAKQHKIDNSIKKAYKNITLYFIAILGLNIISTITSIDNNDNVLNSLLTRTFSIAYIYAFVTYTTYNVRHFEKFCQVLKYVLFILILLSLYAYYFMPAIGRQSEGYGATYLIGIASNRNSFFDIAIPAIVLAFFDINNKKRYMSNIIIIVSAILVMFLSRSMTGIISLAFCGTMIALNQIIKNKQILVKILNTSCFLLLIVAQLLIINNASFSYIAKISNKSDTLSDRTIIWKKAKAYIAKKPLLGYGYDNTVIKNQFDMEEFKNTSFPNDPHNSIFYMMLSSGIIGTTMLISLIIFSIKCGSKLLRLSNKYIFILFLIYTNLIRGITESCWHYSHIIFFIMMFFAIYLYELNKDKCLDEKN